MTDWLTSQQVADKLSPTHVVTVRRWLESGELHGHQRKHRGPWKVHPDAVDALVKGLDGVAACGCARLRSMKRAA